MQSSTLGGNAPPNLPCVPLSTLASSLDEQVQKRKCVLRPKALFFDTPPCVSVVYGVHPTAHPMKMEKSLKDDFCVTMLVCQNSRLIFRSPRRTPESSSSDARVAFLGVAISLGNSVLQIKDGGPEIGESGRIG